MGFKTKGGLPVNFRHNHHHHHPGRHGVSEREKSENPFTLLMSGIGAVGRCAMVFLGEIGGYSLWRGLTCHANTAQSTQMRPDFSRCGHNRRLSGKWRCQDGS